MRVGAQGAACMHVVGRAADTGARGRQCSNAGTVLDLGAELRQLVHARRAATHVSRPACSTVVSSFFFCTWRKMLTDDPSRSSAKMPTDPMPAAGRDRVRGSRGERRSGAGAVVSGGAGGGQPSPLAHRSS